MRHHTRLVSVLVLTGCTALGLALAPQASQAEDAAAPAARDPLARTQRAVVELGRRLFFDPVVSRSGARSCASCHDPEYGFSDPMQRSEDDAGSTVRHSQTLLDSRFNPNAHWDGEFDRIEDLVTARIGLPAASSRGGGYGGGGRSPITPGHSTITPDDPELRTLTESGKLAAELAKLPRTQDLVEEAGRYTPLFVAAFGTREVTRARIAEAIGAYCRTIESTTAPYDAHVAGNPRAMSAAAVRGLKLFKGKAGCATCHLLDIHEARRQLAGSFSRNELTKMTRAPLTDFAFHNTSVAWLRRGDNLKALESGDLTGAITPPASPVPGAVRSPALQKRLEIMARSLLGIEDPGRMRISTVNGDLRAFKTPTLRDVSRRGPYMHDGRYKTLEEVVRHYATGRAAEDPDADERLKAFDISDAEVADLVAFLESLTGTERPGLAQHRCRQRAKKTKLRFLDASGDPLVGLVVKLIPVGDRLPAEAALKTGAQTLTTDARGAIAYTPAATTHMRVQLPDHVEPVSGALIPDTCKEAKVIVPVEGRIRFALSVPQGAAAPSTLRLEHQRTFVLPGHAAPHTRLSLVRRPAEGSAGLAIYEGWRRTDVPSVVRCPLPDGSRTGHDTSKPSTLRAKLLR